MDIQTIFEKFLENTVNLNKGRVERIEDAQRILTDFIKSCEDFKNLYIDTIPQGSFRQKTIIKPVGNSGTFDIDLLIKLKENLDWTASNYHAKLAKAFKDSGTYEDITDTNGKTRCVTIDYKGDFHVDLVPGVEREGGIFICNKNTDEFEATDGDGYAQWFEQQDVMANGYLVPVVRLIKYLRDSREEFDTKSIILTTIAGMQVRPSENFSSLPHALSTILTRMNEFLYQFESAPSIPNPAMHGENFNRHWKNDSKGFSKLKAAIGTYADISDNAIATSDTEEAIESWQELFGEDFFNDDTDKGNTPSNNPPQSPSTGPVIVNRSPAQPWCDV